MNDASPPVSSPGSASASAPLEAAVAIESHGHWCLSTTAGDARFAFYGKATTGVERDLEAALERDGKALSFLRQIHSARVVSAAAGHCGDGDALVARDPHLALRVVTADCVPVLLASDSAIAAVHAGWRGLAAGVLSAAVERMVEERPAQARTVREARFLRAEARFVRAEARFVRAVIGPRIGGCCYEVGDDVAEQVARSACGARALGRGVILDRGPGRRPHLDLGLAARLELERAGVESIDTFAACTRCDAARWWSYRREGKGAGRNVALVWRDR